MTRAQRIQLSDLNLAEANRELSRRAGGAVLDEDGIVLWSGGHPLPVLCNAVLRTDTRMPAAEVLARADAFFGARGRGYTAYLRAHADEDLREAVLEAGFTAMGDSPGMVLDARLEDAQPPAGVTLERVETAAQAEAFAQVMEEAYASLGMPPGVAPAVLGADVQIAPHITSFLARLEDGTPAAGAMCILSHGVAGIYWVGTTPAARGRGLAELCTRAAGNVGFDAGARIAALQASKMGEPIYRKMGYVEVTRYPTLVRFTPPPAPGIEPAGRP